jgi:hypothetical protein
MPATFQPIAWQVRSGPDHHSWQTGDKYTFCCTWSPEWSEHGMGAHLYGAISWYQEDHPAVMDVVRQTKAEGFSWCRWERVDPDTGESRAVRLPKTGRW